MSVPVPPMLSDTRLPMGADLSARSWRLEALAAIALARASSAEEARKLLSGHPAASEAVARLQSAQPLGVLFWDELKCRQMAYGLRDSAGTAPRTPLGYWQARRRLDKCRRWLRAAGQLPELWRDVLSASAASAMAAIEAIGLSGIAAACAGRGEAELVHWLKPLGRELATRVAALMARPAASVSSRSALAAWSAAYDRATRGLRGEALAAQTGLTLLASLFVRLDQNQRDAAGGAARSTLCEALAASAIVELPTGSAIAATERLVAAQFKRGEDVQFPLAAAAEYDLPLTRK